MYISCQARGGDLDTFLEHENHAWPPSLASNNIMHQNTKSELVPCLETLVEPNHDVPNVDVRIVDGAAFVHSLDPKKSRTTTIRTFHDYSLHVFLPYISELLRDVIRVDVVWDVYRRDSLKAQAHQSRGTAGSQMRIANSTSIPMNWTNFLHVGSNKEGLFHLLATAIQEHQFPFGKTVISAYHPQYWTSPICAAHMNKLTRGSCTMHAMPLRVVYRMS